MFGAGDHVHQPFEPELPWPRFSLSANQSDIPQLHTRLAAVDDDQLARLQAGAGTQCEGAGGGVMAGVCIHTCLIADGCVACQFACTAVVGILVPQMGGATHVHGAIRSDHECACACECVRVPACPCRPTCHAPPNT